MKVTISESMIASIHSLSVSTGKDDMVPVLTQIALTREGDALRAMTTDRYMVSTGKYSSVEFDEWEEGETILIDPKALKTVLDIKKADKYSVMPVDIVSTGDPFSTHAVIDGATSITLGKVSGTFPPVMKLFPRDSEANGAPVMSLRPDFIAKLAKLLPPETKPERNRVWRFEFRHSDELSYKPQPVYAVYGDGKEYELEALIQPNLVR